MKKLVLKNFKRRINFIGKRFKYYRDFLKVRFVFNYRFNQLLNQNLNLNFIYFLNLNFFWRFNKFFFFNKLDFNNINCSSVLPLFLYEKQFLFKKLEFFDFIFKNNFISFFFFKKKNSDFLINNLLFNIDITNTESFFLKRYSFDLVKSNFNKNVFFFNNGVFFFSIIEIYKLLIVLYFYKI